MPDPSPRPVPSCCVPACPRASGRACGWRVRAAGPTVPPAGWDAAASRGARCMDVAEPHPPQVVAVAPATALHRTGGRTAARVPGTGLLARGQDRRSLPDPPRPCAGPSSERRGRDAARSARRTRRTRRTRRQCQPRIPQGGGRRGPLAGERGELRGGAPARHVPQPGQAAAQRRVRGLTPGSTATDPAPGAGSDDGQPTTPDGARGRVLVVEDNEINQLVAHGVLHKLGFAVRIARRRPAGAGRPGRRRLRHGADGLPHA